MLLKSFICVFIFSGFFTTQSFAVGSGEILWEVKKPGSVPNYIIGEQHNVVLNGSSLPQEIISS